MPRFLSLDNLAGALALLGLLLHFCSALASYWIRFCSLRYSSFTSWRALMASMTCCKARASLPLNPSRPCLVFLITSKGSVSNVDEIKFYQAPRWAPNVLVGWPQTNWVGKLLFWFVSNWCSNMSLHLDKGGFTCWSHSTIKLVRAFKNIKSVSVSSTRNRIPFTRGLKPLL